MGKSIGNGSLVTLPVGRDRPELPLNIIQWAKACQCKSTTASGPRFFVVGSDDGVSFVVRWSWGPVCDTCDKPWQRGVVK